LVARIESSSTLRRPNWYARFSVVFGVLTLAVGPAAIVASRRIPGATLIDATGAIAASGVLALLTLLLARHGRLYAGRSLGRASAPRLVRTGRALGLIGLCLSLAACIALAFFVVLRVFLA
jgi:hypothetical protein